MAQDRLMSDAQKTPGKQKITSEKESPAWVKGSNYDTCHKVTDSLVGTDHSYLLGTPAFVEKHNVIKHIVSEVNFISSNLGLGKRLSG